MIDLLVSDLRVMREGAVEHTAETVKCKAKDKASPPSIVRWACFVR